ncbi:hypothetical protein BSGG_3443 [Bacteroides sp. D2]|nr:hypothetical protein BSGG_3443 [Bacteroides sp. D2]
MEQFFLYGEREIAYLKSKDKRLREVIDKVGIVKRRVIPDLFTALVHSIVGQQISTKAHETIWRKMSDALGEVTPEKVLNLPPEALQAMIKYDSGDAPRIQHFMKVHDFAATIDV